MAKDSVESHGTPVVDNKRSVSPLANQKFNSPVTAFGTESFTGTPFSRDGNNAFVNTSPSPVETHGTDTPLPPGRIGERCRPESTPKAWKE